MVNDAQVWIPSADAGPIGPCDVHIWRIGLVQTEAVIQRYRKFLAANEIERADRFYFAKDRANLRLPVVRCGNCLGHI